MGKLKAKLFFLNLNLNENELSLRIYTYTQAPIDSRRFIPFIYLSGAMNTLRLKSQLINCLNSRVESK